MHPDTTRQQRRHALALAVCLADARGSGVTHPAPTRLALAAETARLATATAAAPLLRAASTPVSHPPLVVPRRS